MVQLFILLLFAHVLGDFVFQTNKVFRLKVTHLGGVILHSAIFYLLAMIMTYPLSVSNSGYTIWLFLIFISHIVVDKLKIILGKKIIKKEFINFLLDQCIHIALLATLFYVPILNVSRSILVDFLYQIGFSLDNITKIFFLASMLVFVTYAISVLLYYYDSSIKNEQKPLHYNYYRMLSRAVLFLILISTYFPVGIVLIIANYIYSKKILTYDSRRFFLEKTYLLCLVAIYFFVKGMVM